MARTAEHTLHTAGVCEIAAVNPNVASYMNEWEQRTTKAEAALAAQAAEMNRALAEADMHRHDADSLAVKVAELETALAAAEQWASSHAQIVADGETGEGVGSCGTCRNHAIVTCESVCTLVWGAVEQRYLPCEVLGNGCRAWSAREVTP